VYPGVNDRVVFPAVVQLMCFPGFDYGVSCRVLVRDGFCSSGIVALMFAEFFADDLLFNMRNINMFMK